MIITINTAQSDKSGTARGRAQHDAASLYGVGYEKLAAAVTDKGWSSFLKVTDVAGENGLRVTSHGNIRLHSAVA